MDTVAILVEKGVDFCCGEAAKEECLPVELAPAIEHPVSHTREINAMRFMWLLVKMVKHMLGMGKKASVNNVVKLMYSP